MTTATFTSTRADGRSDRRVIFDLAREAETDRIFTYDELRAALKRGLDPSIAIERARICSAVQAANKDLLGANKRMMAVVKNTGYRVIRSEEHLPTAMTKTSSADRLLAKGKSILEQCDMSELSETQRKMHQGYLMVLSANIQFMRESDKRQKKQQTAIDNLVARVAKLEDRS